jgi:hypothetical protein
MMDILEIWTHPLGFNKKFKRNGELKKNSNGMVN